jgi:hypothetical protein
MDKKKASIASNTLNNWSFILILCFTLGLAPFFPEPHFFGKIKWILGGAVGMKFMDWLDLLFHGFPWILLGRLVFVHFKNKGKTLNK